MLLASASLGCFFELDELVPPLSGVGGGGTGGDAASGAGGSSLGGEAPVGGSGGSPVDPQCPPNQKECGSGCVPFAVENGCSDPTCTPCAPLSNATLTCNTDSGACQLAECAAGFADCNADTAAYTGQAGSDGCEYPFGPNGELRETPALLEVPLTDIAIDIGDGERGDWTGIPAYPLLATCNNCVDQSLPEVTAKNEVPPRRDLEAYFRVAWDQDFFYVLGDVSDSALFADGLSLGDGQCQNGALCEDGLAVFFDGRNNRAESPQPSTDDLYVYVSLGGKAFRVSGAPVRTQDLDFKATAHGAACYRLEAKFAWSYVTGVQNGQPVDGQFPPAVGQEYGFDVSVNDWDPSVSDQTPRRESQLFWVNPGNGYQQDTSNFGPIRLTDAVPAAPTGPQ